MISEFDLSKAFRDKLKSITAHTVVSPFQDFTPKPDQVYIKQHVSNGDYVITIDPNNADSMRGFFRIGIYSPINNTEWKLKKLADEIRVGWTKGFTANVEHGGQKVSIENVNASDIMTNEQQTHFYKVLDVYFTVIG